MSEYILKSAVALGATYLLYFIFARKNANFTWLRIYFLTAILISFTFPAFKYLPVLHRHNLVSVPSTYIPNWVDESSDVIVEAENISSSPVQTSKSKLPLSVILQYVYAAGLLFLLLRFIFGLTQLAWLAIKNKVQKIDRDRIVFVKKLPTPFSFFRLIFIDRNDLTDVQKTCMLYHERVHVRQWHSVDLLLLEFITMVQWFNPFSWQIRRALKEIHEYLADEGTVNAQVQPLDYMHLLLVQASGLKAYLPVNGFRNSLTKKRILMITTNKRNRKWVAVFVLLVAAIMATDSLSRINVAQVPKTATAQVFEPLNKDQPAQTTMKYVPEKGISSETDTVNHSKNNLTQQKKTTIKFIPPVVNTKEEGVKNSIQLLNDEIPKNWFKAGSKPKSYIVGIDRNNLKNGHKSVFLQSKDDKIEGFGTLMQTCTAQEYLDKRIKMKGFMKCENVTSWSGMWLRVDKGGQSVSFDNMQDRPIKGTMDWTACEIVLDVPHESNTLNFGFLLNGTGKVWFTDLSFEIVSETEPLTNTKIKTTYPDKPSNINFED